MTIRHTAAEIRRQLRLGLRHVRFGCSLSADVRRVRRLAALETVFRATNALLRDLGVDYWIADGTLLGYHREGAILGHDVDVDLAAHERDFETVRRAAERLPPGFRMYNTTHRHRGPKLYVAHQGWEADIYFYEDLGDRLRSYEDSDVGGIGKPFPMDYVFPTQEAPFLGVTTRIPNKPEAMLRHVYGSLSAHAVQDRTTGYWHDAPEASR